MRSVGVDVRSHSSLESAGLRCPSPAATEGGAGCGASLLLLQVACAGCPTALEARAANIDKNEKTSDEVGCIHLFIHSPAIEIPRVGIEG